MTETPTRTQTYSAVLQAPRNFDFVRIPRRDLAADEVRIQLEGCGVCGSDLAVWKGAPWFDYPLEAGAPGHEGWGRISAVGRDVTRFQVGDRVSALSYHAYAEFDTARASEVVKLPPALDDMPFPGEPLGCAMNVFERSRVEAGMTVAIVGVGFMGVLLTALCVDAGAEVIGISRRSYALEMARNAGAKHTIQLNDNADAVVQQVNSLTGDQGCDVVIEATGHAEPLALAARLTAIRGRLVIAGYHQDGSREIDMQLWNWRGIDVINAHERDPQRYVSGMERAVKAVESGVFDFASLYTFVPLRDLGRAFEMMNERPDGFMKVLVLP